MFVCGACGKMSRDKYGNEAISHGWDESCMLNCGLYNEADLDIKDGLVIKINN